MNNFIHNYLNQFSSIKTFWIAYSGGLDSHVLLHILSNYPAQVKAIHVHHGLNKKADRWAEHCQKICLMLNISLQIEYIHLEPPHRNIEALAREKRYAVFSNLIGENEALLTAHHQDDQAETLLLQLFRGAGLKGLSAMSEHTDFTKGKLIRPLLNFTRNELTTYANHHQLNWIEDDSNHHMHFHRNFLRHQVLPLMQTRWPALSKTLARSAAHMATAQHLLDELAQQDLHTIITPKKTLLIDKLVALPEKRQHNTLRYWLNQLNFILPTKKKLLEIQKILTCKSDAKPLVTWENIAIRRYRNELYAFQKIPSLSCRDGKFIIEWEIHQTIEVNGHIFSKTDLLTQGIDLSGITTLTIQFRQGGERCRLKGYAHSKSLKKIFQEWSVPPWMRDQIPLIYHKEKLIAIWNYAACD